MKKLTARQTRKLISREFKSISRQLFESNVLNEQADEETLAIRKRLARDIKDMEDEATPTPGRIGKALADLDHLAQIGNISRTERNTGYKLIRGFADKLKKDMNMSQAADTEEEIQKSLALPPAKRPAAKSL
jgi:hypothetical protein